MADALIAGGGVAGSSLAIMLGRKGLAVQLFEKARFPREKPCGEGLLPEGAAVLQRLGLLASVGGRPFYGVRFHFEGQAGQGITPKLIRFRSPGFGQRRRVLISAGIEERSEKVEVSSHSRGKGVGSPQRLAAILEIPHRRRAESTTCNRPSRRGFLNPI